MLHSGTEGLPNHLVVDLTAQVHALLELRLVVGLGTLSLQVLVHSVDLALVADKSLFDLAQAVVDVILDQLVLLRVVRHRVVRRLLRAGIFVLRHQALDHLDSVLVFLKSLSQFLGMGKLIGDVILHLVDAVGNLVHFPLDSEFEVLNFLKVRLAGFYLRLKTGSSLAGVVELSLLKVQVLLEVLDVHL